MKEVQNPFELLNQQLIDILNQLRVLEKKIDDPKNENSKDLLNITEISEFLDLKKQTIYNLCSQRKLPYIKKLGRLYFKKNEILNWLEENSIV